MNTVSTTGPGSGTALAREAIRAGADLVAVCGGDGTINEVVCGMAGSRVPLAVLPAGTANTLARELRLPLNIRAAARLIPSAIPRRLALGRAGDRYFLLMAGVGLDAQVIQKIRAPRKEFLGMASYFLETLFYLLARPLTPFAVVAEEKRVKTTFACISKAQYYGPFRMIRQADFFSEHFYVYCFPARSRFLYFFYALGLLTGQLAWLPGIHRFPARKVHCEEISGGSHRVPFQVDGELAGRLPCTIEIVPDALTLLVPARP